MKTKTIPLTAAAAMTLLTACYHGLHEMMPSEYGDDEPVGYLTPLLEWEDTADTDTPVSTLSFTVSGISGTGGSNLTQSFSSDTETAAEQLQQLPAGDYDLLVTADMDEDRGYIIEDVGTRADEPPHTALPDTRVSLRDPSSSPRQAWYAVTRATVKPDEITVAEFSLQRLLAEVTVIMRGVPPGGAVGASVEGVAHDVLLTQRDGEGRYGVADREDHLTVDLGALGADPADPGTLRRDGHTLLPTAAGRPRCHLTLSVTTPEGTRLSYLADAPRMECGKTYVVELNYSGLAPYMLLEAFSISGWTEGWAVSGEILNPAD